MSSTTTTFATQPTVNPNRELLKRIGQITEHSNKQITAIIVENFPGDKSDRLSDLEIRTVVNQMCVDVAVQRELDESKAVVACGEWLSKLDPEIGNEERARLWMKQLEVLMF